MGNLEYLPNLSDLLFLNRKQIILQTSFQSTNELSAYLKANRYNFLDSKFSLVYPFKITNDTINYELYNTGILLKNLTLRNRTQVEDRIRENKDTNLINTLDEFHVIKRQLNKYAALPKANQPVGIKELENKAGLLEKNWLPVRRLSEKPKNLPTLHGKMYSNLSKKTRRLLSLFPFNI